MKTNTLKKQSKLTTYLALTAGAGFAATAANGAVVVTFYGPGATSTTSSPPTPAGIKIGASDSIRALDTDSSENSFFRFDRVSGLGYFSRGSDIAGAYAYRVGVYREPGGSFSLGAIAGDENYANVSFNGNDGVYEAVAQFHFGPDGTSGVGKGYLIAIARNSDSSALSISAGKAAITAAIPEPGSLALLALGSAGLLARRNRKLAA